MKRSPFIHRSSEQHGHLNFTPEGVAEQVENLKRLEQMGMNRACMGQCWPDGMLYLVDYRETLPELASAELTARVAENREGFRLICEEADRRGIEAWPSLNILNYPDDFTDKFTDAIAIPPKASDRWMPKSNGRGLSKHPQLCASSKSFKRLAVAQMTELCQLPGVVGVECWLTAADTDLFYCECEICREKSAAEMISQFAHLVFPVCERFGKGLMLRTYLGGWRCGLETEVWREVGEIMPLGMEIAYKQQAGDFMNWHGANPLAGEFGGAVEHVEFDLAGEYRGINFGIVSTVRKQLTELIRHFSDCGVQGVMFRKVGHVHAFDLDKWLFAALAIEPDLDEETWSLKWARERFGEAGEGVLEVLDTSADVVRKVMYINGVQWASWAVPHNLGRLRFILFDRSAPCVEGAWERLQPTGDHLLEIKLQKQEAIAQAESLLVKCEALKDRLTPEHYAPLRASCAFLALYARLAAPLIQSFFTFLKWEKTSSEVSREYVRVDLLDRLDEADAAMKAARTELESIDLIALATLVEEGRPPEDFCEPIVYAEKILREMRERIQVDPSSWWSVYPWPDRWPENLRVKDELYEN